MAAHAMRYARRRRWPARVLGVLATAALLGTGVAIALMVMPEREPEAAAPPPASSTQGAAAKTGLTAEQRATRRAAVRTLSEQGFEPVRLADWRPEHRLRVLVGRDQAGAERAFFFVKRRFVGNDDAAASASVRVVQSSGTRVTLSYQLYSADGTKGERVKVAFRWEDGTLSPAGTVPPAEERVR